VGEESCRTIGSVLYAAVASDEASEKREEREKKEKEKGQRRRASWVSGRGLLQNLLQSSQIMLR